MDQMNDLISEIRELRRQVEALRAEARASFKVTMSYDQHRRFESLIDGVPSVSQIRRKRIAQLPEGPLRRMMESIERDISFAHLRPPGHRFASVAGMRARRPGSSTDGELVC